MADTLANSSGQETLISILSDARKFARSNGVTSASYRLVPAFHSQLGKDAVLFHFGFPDAWVALYDHDHEFRQHDPIADYVMRIGETRTWKQAVAEQDLSPEQAAFVRSMTDHGLIDGWAIPIYGPHGREAYVTFSFGRKLIDEDAKRLESLISYTAALHNRIVALTQREWGTITRLSRRENEVLTWVARGKSNTDIATILEISTATVGTLMRRIFYKLQVNDRMAATLKGLQHGIIRL